MGEKIPKVWLNFENRILSERMKKKNYLKWEMIRQFAMDQGIFDERDVKMAVQLLHDLGTIQYFDNDFLRDYVVINPQWIVDVMACVVSAQSSPIQQNHGRFLHEDIPNVWAKYDPALHQWLLRLTEDFDLTFPLPSEPVNIVPCLLPGEQPDDVHWENVGKKEGVRETKMVYRFTYLPSGLFNRAQVRLFQLSDGEKVWKKGSLLTKNKHSALIKQTDNRELVVFVRGPRPENILFLIHEVFESIIEESFNGVSYDLYLPCPDCVEKEGTTDPDMLCAKLIQRAKNLKAPFITCYKYFHWISMAQLQEKMPADSREMAEFDFHLQQSIVAFEELNSDLGVDVAILYSRLDLPQAGDDDALSPLQIRDDIIEWGHTCWFPEEIDTVSLIDLSTAIKNCKILIALVSDHFERDRQCVDIFLHAREAMNKATMVVVLGKSMEWEKKDLGMKIGQQERKLMAKTRSRYECANGRRDELKEWLTEILQGIKEKEVTMPEVFISYCQRNSYLATKNQEKYNESALGYGDPRDLCFRLEHEGKFNCWIDTEYIGKEKKGIFADMAVGIRNSKVFVAFVSDEYAESDNCLMELRFGILNMGLPVVAVIVGTGSKWKQTEVGMLLARAKALEVYLQKENPEGVKVLIQYVGEALATQKLTEKKNAEASGKDKKKHVKLAEVDTERKGNSSVAYQEEVELIQRKFMRHILGSIASLDQMPMPRLIIVDFVKDSSSKGKSEEGRESSVGNTKSYRRTQRAPISKKGGRPRSSRDRLNVDENSLEETDDTDDWSTESFCIQVLCEHEQGWHLCPQKFPLAFRNRELLEVFLQKAAPYLYRIYTILKQGPIKLKCFSPGKGKAYLDWIRLACEDNLDFVGALTHLRSELAKDETKEILGCLARCRLPSGKIVWLCGEHQQMQRVSKLSTGNSGGSYSRKVVLYTEDKLMSERIIESAEYKVLKAGSDKHFDPVKPEPLNPKQPKAEEVVALNDSKKENDDTPDSEGRNKKVGDEESKAFNLLNEHDKKINSDTKSEAILLKEPDKKIDSDTKSEAILLKGQDKKIDSDIKSEAILLKEPDKKIDSDIKSEAILLKGQDKKIDSDKKTEAILIESEKKEIQSDILQSEKDEIKSVRTQFVKRIIQSSEPVSEKHTIAADRPEVPLTKNVFEDFIKEDTTDKIETIQETNDAEVRNGTHLEDTESAKDIDTYQKTQKVAQQTPIEQKEDVKRMLLESDNTAIRKALKASNTSQLVSKSRMVQSTDSRVQLPPNPASKYGSIARGSNVKRLMTQSSATELNKHDVSIAHSKIKSTRSNGGLPNMDASLNITPVKQGFSASSVSSVESRKSAIGKEKKSEVHPLERVRPRKINVKPQSDKDNGRKESGPSFAATGRSVQNQDRSPAGGNQKTSQACSLQ
ncbi:uncharacterized protein LOC127881358 isoform X1 [Dreissena polymorpha]|nr:uncharacterized protein LOC127881358 isoform X1 [Dreissena polymorpha]